MVVKNVVVGEGLLARLAEFVPSGRRVIVLADPNVYALYRGAIDPMGECVVLPAGEEHKTLDTVGKVCEKLIGTGADRRTFIVGVGGGITTDVAGFTASTYMRGVDFGFVATSLLAQVDASVGGKNGVNVGGFKNMAGVFRQPDFVLCDTGMLSTLPVREFRAGLAEMIKAGIIGSPELFEILETRSPEHLMADKELLTKAISLAIEVKARVVEADETERGERRKLNLGHTFGHAIEKLAREGGRSSETVPNHGEAVAVGMVEACRVSREMGLLDERTAERIFRTIERAGLPTSVDLPREDMVAAATRDKKVEGDGVWFVLPRAIGLVEVRKISL